MTFEKAQNQIYFSIDFNNIYCAFIFQVVLLISHWLEMGSAMMRPTTQVASTMVENAVSTSTLMTALIVLVIIRKIVPLGLLPLLLETVSAMTRQTMLTAIMMVETAVDMPSILITALIVHVITRRLALLVLIP